ncbi:hypothetical protein, partial [Vibrio parahaemolyticus]|uniref:hypothetical protein n=1 Tax=Vibrio parahaemolyticus TaxID=670 RepID=UPI001C5F84F1
DTNPLNMGMYMNFPWCFAVGLVTARMLLYKILVNVASRVLVLPNYRGNVCPMCQQPTQIH